MKSLLIALSLAALCGGGARADDPDRAAADAVVAKTNEYRRQEGREPLQVEPHLRRAAEEFAAYMARTTNYGHTADGTTPADRATAQGYEFCIIAENIGYESIPGGATPDELGEHFFRGWQRSPEHRKNLLDEDVTDVGVALARSDANAMYYGVQMFGRPQSRGISFTITNTTAASVDYALGGATFTLPPNVVRTHQECRPETLELKDAGSTSGTLRVERDVQLAVIRSPDGSLQIAPAER